MSVCHDHDLADYRCRTTVSCKCGNEFIVYPGGGGIFADPYPFLTAIKTDQMYRHKRLYRCRGCGETYVDSLQRLQLPHNTEECRIPKLRKKSKCSCSCSCDHYVMSKKEKREIESQQQDDADRDHQMAKERAKKEREDAQAQMIQEAHEKIRRQYESKLSEANEQVRIANEQTMQAEIQVEKEATRAEHAIREVKTYRRKSLGERSEANRIKQAMKEFTEPGENSPRFDDGGNRFQSSDQGPSASGGGGGGSIFSFASADRRQSKHRSERGTRSSARSSVGSRRRYRMSSVASSLASSSVSRATRSSNRTGASSSLLSMAPPGPPQVPFGLSTKEEQCWQFLLKFNMHVQYDALREAGVGTLEDLAMLTPDEMNQHLSKLPRLYRKKLETRVLQSVREVLATDHRTDVEKSEEENMESVSPRPGDEPPGGLTEEEEDLWRLLFRFDMHVQYEAMRAAGCGTIEDLHDLTPDDVEECFPDLPPLYLKKLKKFLSEGVAGGQEEAQEGGQESEIGSLRRSPHPVEEGSDGQDDRMSTMSSAHSDDVSVSTAHSSPAKKKKKKKKHRSKPSLSPAELAEAI